MKPLSYDMYTDHVDSWVLTIFSLPSADTPLKYVKYLTYYFDMLNDHLSLSS